MGDGTGLGAHLSTLRRLRVIAEGCLGSSSSRERSQFYEQAVYRQSGRPHVAWATSKLVLDNCLLAPLSGRSFTQGEKQDMRHRGPRIYETFVVRELSGRI